MYLIPSFVKPGTVYEWPPDALKVSGVNLKAAATTKYVTPFMNWGGLTQFFLTFITTVTGATTVGTAKITLDAYASDGTTKLIAAKDIVTAITRTTTGTLNVAWDTRVTGSAKATGTGTITAADFDAFKVLGAVTLTVEVATQYDSATSSVGSLYLRAQ